ncbi:MAG: CHAT domain-containing protein [Myxococcota bacterium]|jgi:CHAT domain-containing protein/tetratricopeptide (TPR) repeat protein|nr:CHAT domain-containing protein [Myxococcota bacterium]
MSSTSADTRPDARPPAPPGALEELLTECDRFAGQDFAELRSRLDGLPEHLAATPLGLALRGFVHYRLDEDEQGERLLSAALAAAGDEARTAGHAARWLAQLHAHHGRLERALAYAEAAARLAPPGPGGARGRGGAALTGGQVLTRLGRPAEAAARLEQAAREFAEAGEVERLLFALQHLVPVLRLLGGESETWPQLLELVGEVLPDEDALSWEQGCLLAELLALYGLEQEPRELLAGAAARHEVDPTLQAEALKDVALALATSCWHDEAALRFIEEALALPAADPELRAHLLLLRAKLELGLGQTDRAAASARLSLAVVDAPADLRLVARLNLAWALLQAGHTEEAARELLPEAALDDPDPPLDSELSALSLRSWGLIWLRRGHPRRARDLLQRAASYCGELVADQRLAILDELAAAHLLLDELEEAATVLEQGDPLCALAGPTADCNHLLLAAETLLRLGAPGGRELARQGLRRGRELGHPLVVAVSRLLLLTADVLGRRGDAAAGSGRRALAATRDFPHLRAQVRWLQGQVPARGPLPPARLDHARRCLQDAARLYAGCGYLRSEIECLGRAAALAARARRRPLAIRLARRALDRQQLLLGLEESEPGRLALLESAQQVGAQLVALLRRTPGGAARALPVVFEVKSGEFLRLLQRDAVPARAPAAVAEPGEERGPGSTIPVPPEEPPTPAKSLLRKSSSRGGRGAAQGRKHRAETPQAYMRYVEDGSAGADAPCADASAAAAERFAQQAPRLFAGPPGLLRAPPALSPAQIHRAAARHRELTRQAGPFTPVRVGARQVQDRLAHDEVLVEYFLPAPGGRELLAFLVQPEGVRSLRLPWSPQAGQTIGACAELIRGQASVAAALASPLLQASLGELHARLVAPLLPRIPAGARLRLSPGASLADVPFAALLDAAGRPLGERHEVSLLVSGAQLPHLPRGGWSAQRGRRTRPTVLVARGGDPEEDGAGSGAGMARRASEEEAGRAGPSRDADGLPGADRECRELRARLGPRTRLLELPRGAEPVTAAAGLAGVDLLHYAGHASFSAEEGLAATLHLPGGPLQAVDLLGLRLPRRPLVVLSGCETGRGAAWGGEALGFVRALFSAGAAAVIASSWRVANEATCAWMAHFYDGLFAARLSPAAAACRAARRLRATAGWEHPFFWAAFGCWGT